MKKINKKICIAKNTFRFDNEEIVVLFTDNKLDLIFKNKLLTNLNKNREFIENSLQEIINHFKNK